MQALFKAIPDPQVVIAMQPEELAGKIMFLLQVGPATFSPHNLENEIFTSNGPTYPVADWEQVAQAVREALSWMVAQGLIIPTRGNMGANTWMMLSRRATGFASAADFEAYRQARKLDKDSLHPKIAQPVWQAFVRGEYDVAVFLSMKAVETSVKEASGLPDLGVPLMRSAFHPTTGPLRDAQGVGGEPEARAALFAGAIGSFKNPQSHRDVNLNSPEEAIEIIRLANHLLRIVDRHVPSQ